MNLIGQYEHELTERVRAGELSKSSKNGSPERTTLETLRVSENQGVGQIPSATCGLTFKKLTGPLKTLRVFGGTRLLSVDPRILHERRRQDSGGPCGPAPGCRDRGLHRRMGRRWRLWDRHPTVEDNRPEATQQRVTMTPGIRHIGRPNAADYLVVVGGNPQCQ